MSEPFVGEIRMFAGNFAPRGWAFCNGAMLAVSQYDALFSLLGTTYGGDGRTTFGLPDMRGRLPLHAGTGPGLSPRTLGAHGGSEAVTLQTSELPVHSHLPKATAAAADQNAPGPTLVLATGSAGDAYSNASPDTPLADASIANVGGSQAHDNLMPSLCVNFIIALFGIYPSRT